ncbi:MAG: MFS transporter [Myxococcota bacterium]
MSNTEHFTTKPEERIPLAQKLIYGLGGFVNNLLAAAVGGMVVVLNLHFGMSLTLVGLVSSLPRLTDAITDPLMGFISDNTRTRWGRRRPYIFAGAILAGLTFLLLWQLPPGKSDSWYFWYFLVVSFVFYLAYTIFATPWVALGYELTPDYHERTRLMGVQNFFSQLAYLVSPWFLYIMQYDALFDDLIEGAQGLALGVAALTIGLGILPAIFLRERLHPGLQEAEKAPPKRERMKAIGQGVVEFLRGFAAAIKVKAFLQLCGATFLVFNGFMLIASFQLYVIIYYVCAGDQEMGSKLAGYAGSFQTMAAFVVIAIVTVLATKIGKRKAFFVATGLSMLGYVMKWFCYTPDNPWLTLVPAPFIAFGLGALFTLMPSMVADVCDMDELQTSQRREGMFGSIFWWVVKLGMAVALAGGGVLLDWTGFNVDLGASQAAETLTWMRLCDAFVPCIASGLAMYMVFIYPLTEKRAHDIREELERRRGSVEAAVAA